MIHYLSKKAASFRDSLFKFKVLQKDDQTDHRYPAVRRAYPAIFSMAPKHGYINQHTFSSGLLFDLDSTGYRLCLFILTQDNA